MLFVVEVEPIPTIEGSGLTCYFLLNVVKLLEYVYEREEKAEELAIFF